MISGNLTLLLSFPCFICCHCSCNLDHIPSIAELGLRRIRSKIKLESSDGTDMIFFQVPLQ
jgi:hypothetical protein